MVRSDVMVNVNLHILSMCIFMIMYISTRGSASPVGVASAKVVVERFVRVESKSDSRIGAVWKNAQVSVGPVFSNRSGENVAYCFYVVRLGRVRGYVMAAADTLLPPILEWSLGPCPYTKLAEESRRQLANAVPAKSRSIRYRLLYAAPGFAFGLSSSQDSNGMKDSWLELHSNMVRRGKFPYNFNPLAAGSPRVSSAWTLLRKSSVGSVRSRQWVIDDIPRLPMLRSSHVVSTGCALATVGAVSPNENTKGYLARLGNFIEHCLCDQPDKPIASNITAGSANFCRLRGLPVRSHELAVKGASRLPRLGYQVYVESIEAGRPMVLTYSIHPSDNDYEHAKLRLGAVSVLGYGYREDLTGKYIVAYFPSGASDDGKPTHLPVACDQPGVAFVNWDAPASGLIAVAFEGIKAK